MELLGLDAGGEVQVRVEQPLLRARLANRLTVRPDDHGGGARRLLQDVRGLGADPREEVLRPRGQKAARHDDEALRLARAVGVDLDTQVVSVLAEKKGSDLLIWDSARRAAKGALGPADGSRAMIDAVHHAANIARTRTLQAAHETLVKTGADKEPAFLAALEAVLEVLPVSKQFSGIDLDGDLASAGSDFEALENLRRLAFAGQVDEPKQLDLWRMYEAA